MKIVNKILEGIGMTDKKLQKKIRVRFPDWTGDRDQIMTIQELRDNHGECMIIDPNIGEQVSIEDLANLNIPEVVAMPPIRGG